MALKELALIASVITGGRLLDSCTQSVPDSKPLLTVVAIGTKQITHGGFVITEKSGEAYLTITVTVGNNIQESEPVEKTDQKIDFARNIVNPTNEEKQHRIVKRLSKK